MVRLRDVQKYCAFMTNCVFQFQYGAIERLYKDNIMIT